MRKNKLFLTLIFALIPSWLICSATTRNASAETPNSSKLIQCLKDVRNSRTSQAIANSPTNQRIQARVEVAVDTDGRGNVSNVRLVRSSGNHELDEMVLRQARNWKLKPTTGNIDVRTRFRKRQNVCSGSNKRI
ncbi:MAG: TonB family protein [Nostoc sp. LPT]|nr:TonB family protein [Nostoc sp. LPT]